MYIRSTLATLSIITISMSVLYSTIVMTDTADLAKGSLLYCHCIITKEVMYIPYSIMKRKGRRGGEGKRGGMGRGREGEKGERRGRGRGRGGKEIQIKVVSVVIGIVQGWKYRFISAGVIFQRQEARPVGAVKHNRDGGCSYIST